MSTEALFQPFKFKGLHLKNRVVMAPMTRSFSPGGVPTEDVAQYYRRRAEDEVGLIISEGTGRRPAGLAERSEHSALPWRERTGGLEAGDRRGARRQAA